MPHNLESVSGLQEIHRRTLADKLSITSLGDLADADQRAVWTALRNLRQRPSLARVAAWQEEARRRLNEAAIDRSAWHTAASFVVIFAQRQIDSIWERRVEAEQTEVEPAPEPQQWAGWDCGPLCDWMLANVGMPENSVGSETGVPSQTVATAGQPAARAASAPAKRVELRIDSASVTDAFHEQDLVSGGKVTPAPPKELTPPVRLRVTVSGGRSGQQLMAAVWFRGRAAPGWTPQEPVSLPPSGQADFDLSSVSAGGHDVRLLAWATDPGAAMTAVTLPRLTFRQAADRDDGLAVAQAGP